VITEGTEDAEKLNRGGTECTEIFFLKKRSPCPPCLLCCGRMSSSTTLSRHHHADGGACPPPSRPPTQPRPAQAAEGLPDPRACDRHLMSSTREHPSVGPHAGPAMSHGFVTQRSSSIRARGDCRGPQRLCSLSPDTSAATPSPWRSRAATLHDPCAARVSGAGATYAAVTIAPAGTTPVVTYRHSAITSLRATATIPIRRPRFPVPKRARYHCVRALWGCHRTQFHAS
jgi:hypothetical protein